MTPLLIKKPVSSDITLMFVMERIAEHWEKTGEPPSALQMSPKTFISVLYQMDVARMFEHPRFLGIPLEVKLPEKKPAQDQINY